MSDVNENTIFLEGSAELAGNLPSLAEENSVAFLATVKSLTRDSQRGGIAPFVVGPDGQPADVVDGAASPDTPNPETPSPLGAAQQDIPDDNAMDDAGGLTVLLEDLEEFIFVDDSASQDVALASQAEPANTETAVLAQTDQAEATSPTEVADIPEQNAGGTEISPAVVACEVPANKSNETVIVVEDSAGLIAAMEVLAKGDGGTILMKNAGSAYNVSIYDAGDNEAAVKITSFDENDPAVIERLTLSGVENITIDGVVFDSSASTEVRAPYMRDLWVQYSTDITIQNSTFRSDAEGTLTDVNGDNVGALMGMVRNSNGFTFSNNEVSGYASGLGVFETIGVVITENDFNNIQADGMQLSGVQNVLIEDNYMHDFLGSLQSVNHDDMIQFWGTNATLRTENVIIRGNILDASNGSGAQAIFGRNEEYETEEDLFQNILIENNVIHNGSYHGITMYDTNGLTIRNNTVLWNEDAEIHISLDEAASYTPGIRTTNSTNVSISNNIAPSISAPDGVDVSNNAIITYDDTSADGYVENHFVNALVGGDGDLRDLKLLSDSDWVGTFGSSYTQPTATADSLTAVMVIQAVQGDVSTFVFNAALSQDQTGYLNESDTIFTWTFGDNTVLTGMSVMKTFTDIGENEVSLTVTTNNSSTDSITRSLDVQDKNLVSLNFDGSVVDSSSYSSIVTVVSPSDGPAVDGVTGDGFVLDGTSAVQIGRHNEHILGLDVLSLGMAVKLDPTSDGNTFLAFHQSMGGTIEDDGSVQFHLMTVDGTFTVNSAAGLISDTEWHKIDVTYDSLNESLILYVDGDVVAAIEATGQMKSLTYWNLDIGSSWGNSIKGVVDDFTLQVNVKTAAEINADFQKMEMALNRVVYGDSGDNALIGDAGDNTLYGGDGADTLNGGGGNDVIVGGDTSADLRDVVFAGAGNDSIDGGYGNDLIYGMDGNDQIVGGFGSDTINGQNGDDVITGSALSDLLSGNAGDDFINGGFGHDRLNGGAGADSFYHLGVKNHGGDWIQDFSDAEGDVLIFGTAGATKDDFQINYADNGAGDASVDEAYVIYKPRLQDGDNGIVWALVDGADLTSLTIQIAGGGEFDLLA